VSLGLSHLPPASGIGLFTDSLGDAVRPRNGGDVFRYRLHSPDGDDLGEATYAMSSAFSPSSRSTKRTSRRWLDCCRSRLH